MRLRARHRLHRPEVVQPGFIEHIYGNQCPLGEPSGKISDEITQFSELLTAAVMKAPAVDHIHDEIYLKL